MAKTQSQMIALGTQAPAFRLPNTNTPEWKGLAKAPVLSLAEIAFDLEGRARPGILVAFLCNHCPYVKHIRTQFAYLTAQWMKRGLGVVGINSNDALQYPDDSPIKMQLEAQEAGYVFPYLYDESQGVAKAYDAACTPDFYLFDASQQLVYRGQFDDSRPGDGRAVSGSDLNAAVEALLLGKTINFNQIPSLGCNIKWKF